MISPALTDAMGRWLDHERALNAAAQNTLTAYQGDVLGFLAFMQTHHAEAQGLGPIARVTVSDMRAWMAHERARGLSARSLARALSAVKTCAHSSLAACAMAARPSSSSAIPCPAAFLCCRSTSQAFPLANSENKPCPPFC